MATYASEHDRDRAVTREYVIRHGTLFVIKADDRNGCGMVVDDVD